MITVVGNLKGGTGKSTVTFNLALWLAAEERAVRACDLDPQATLRDVFEVRAEEGHVPLPALLTRLPDEGDDGEILADVGLSGIRAMNKALARADRVLIPVAPSQADVWSTQQFLSNIEDHLSPRARARIIAFVNRADTHPMARETGETLDALRQLKGIRVLDARLGQRTAFRRSFSEGLAVFELEPRGKAAGEIEALAEAIFGQP